MRKSNLCYFFGAEIFKQVAEPFDVISIELSEKPIYQPGAAQVK
jgi:hypothetical protein